MAQPTPSRPCKAKTPIWAAGVVVAAIVATTASTATIPYVLHSHANRVEDWLPLKYPEVQDNLWFQKHFGGDEFIVVSWPGCTIDDERLDTLASEIASRASRNEITTFRRVLTGRQLLNDLTTAPVSLSKDEALSRLRDWMVGPDGSTTCAALMLDSVKSPDRQVAVGQVIAALVESCGLSETDIRIGGPTVDVVNIDRASLYTLSVLAPASLLVGMVVAWLCLRRLRLALAAVGTAALCQLVVFALLWATSAHVDAVVTIVPLLVYTITITAVIHYLECYRDQQSSSERSPVKALAITWWPTTLAFITTAIGLASMSVSELAPVARFGTYGAGGVLCALVIALLLPVAILSLRSGDITTCVPPSFFEAQLMRAVMGVATVAVEKRRAVIASAVAVLVALGVASTRVTTSALICDMFASHSRQMGDYRWLESSVAPLVPLNVVIAFADTAVASFEERAGIVREAASQLAAHSQLRGVVAPTSFLPPQFSEEAHAAKGTGRRAVANVRTRRQRTKLIERGLIADADGEELWLIAGRVSMFTRVGYGEGEIVEEITNLVSDVIARDGSQLGGSVRAVVTGGTPVIMSVQARLLESLNDSLWTSLALIGLVMAIGLGSPFGAIVLLIPNVLPVAVVFGTIGLVGRQVDLGAMLTISTAIGMAVDNELHFVSRYRLRLRECGDRRRALMDAMRECGVSIVASAIICCLGLSVLLLSAFLPSVRFGGLMIVLIAIAVVADIVVLPAIVASRFGAWLIDSPMCVWRVRQRGSLAEDSSCTGSSVNHR